MKNLARVGFLATFLVAAAPPGVVASEAPCGTLEGLHARPDCESFAEGTGAAPARCRPPRGEPPASRRSRAPVGSSVEGRAHEPRPGLPARALAAPPEGVARFTGSPVSLDVKDAELGEIVRTLTAGRGLSVVAPPGLAGSVTATLRDVPWDQALDLVLAGNGWGYVREGTVIRIVQRDDPGR